MTTTLPQILEYRDLTSDNTSNVTVLDVAGRHTLAHHTAGYECAGSAARYTAARYSVTYNDRGIQAGRNFGPAQEVEARAYLAEAHRRDVAHHIELRKYRPGILRAQIDSARETLGWIEKGGRRGKRGDLVGQDAKRARGLRAQIAQWSVDLETAIADLESAAYAEAATR